MRPLPFDPKKILCLQFIKKNEVVFHLKKTLRSSSFFKKNYVVFSFQKQWGGDLIVFLNCGQHFQKVEVEFHFQKKLCRPPFKKKLAVVLHFSKIEVVFRLKKKFVMFHYQIKFSFIRNTPEKNCHVNIQGLNLKAPKVQEGFLQCQTLTSSMRLKDEE